VSRSVEIRGDSSDAAEPPHEGRPARRGMWTATFHAARRGSPLLAPAHVVEGVAGLVFTSAAVVVSVVLIAGAPAAGNAAADTAIARQASLTIVTARTEVGGVPGEEAPGSAREPVGTSLLRLGYVWDGMAVDDVVTPAELAAAGADHGGVSSSVTRVWIDRHDGSIVRAPQEPENARLQAMLLRAVEVCSLVLAAITGSRLVTSASLRWRGRWWARAWQHWDRQDGVVPPSSQ
jgi:hypothetical protein